MASKCQEFPSQYFCAFSFGSQSKQDLHTPSPVLYLLSQEPFHLYVFIYASSSPCVSPFSFFLTRVFSTRAHCTVSPHVCLWPLFIRLLLLSWSLQSLPINYEEKTFLLLEMVRGACGYALLYVSYIFPRVLPGTWARGVCGMTLEGFYDISTAALLQISLCIRASALKFQLAHGCCTAAALFLDPPRNW